MQSNKLSLQSAAIIIAIASAAVLTDQITKFLAVSQLQQAHEVFPFFRLALTYNEGIAFGFALPQSALKLGNLALILILFFVFMSSLDTKKPLTLLISGLFFGGAAGNMIDRFAHGAVIDFIAVGAFPVFNVADSLLTVSVFMIVLFYDRIRVPKQNKQQKNA